ncbi:OmpP1/FadL family transporter [Jannaschia faecimaris]|nr:outer membrane protein transport protein [Jannaschia faecimaris]
MAGGLDRSGQNIDIIFETGTVAELSFGYVSPSVDGVDQAGVATGEVADSFIQGSLAYKQQINDQLSFAIIVDQPYGADIQYSAASPVLGGTSALVNTTSVTGMLRYKLNDRFSVHGGMRAQTLAAKVTLDGLAYGGPFPVGRSGYSPNFEKDLSYGYQVGAAYEIPEIALRLAVTYFSEIDHDLRTTENFAAGVTNTPVTTPQAINISFQTGIAKDTLAFASFRYADYTVTKVRPRLLGGTSLTDIDTARDYTIGVGRRFNDQFSGAVSLNYSHGGPDDLVSPLGPTDGRYGITLSGSYQVTDAVKISGGINYSRLGDARPKTNPPNVARANFDGNSLIGVGFKIGYRF